MALSTTTLLLAVLCAPQGSTGPMVGTPHTISVSPGTTGGSGAPLGPADLLFKEGGMVATAPAPLPTGLPVPDFRMTAIMGGLASMPDVDGQSIGLDWVLADATGRVAIPSGGWGMITFSVSRTATGASGVIQAEAATPGGAHSDLFSYILPGSIGAPSIVGVTERGQDQSEIALGGAVGNMDAHDVFAAAYTQAPAIVALLPREPTFFFTVTKATLGSVPGSWWGGSTPSGATIFMTTWNATTGKWPTPTPFLLYSDLQLAASEDVDALAIDTVRGRILFSTTTASRDELLVGIPQSGGALAIFDYTLQNGEPVTKGLGLLKVDNIDGVCGLDPGAGPGAGALQRSVGVPTWPPLLPVLGQVSASVYRTYDRASRQDFLNTILTGWPRRGVPQPSFAVLGFTFPSFPFAPLVVLGPFQRQQSRLFQGGPLHVPLQVPLSASGRGLDVLFHWVTAESANPGLMDGAPPVLVRL